MEKCNNPVFVVNVYCMTNQILYVELMNVRDDLINYFLSQFLSKSHCPEDVHRHYLELLDAFVRRNICLYYNSLNISELTFHLENLLSLKKYMWFHYW